MPCVVASILSYPILIPSSWVKSGTTTARLVLAFLRLTHLVLRFQIQHGGVLTIESCRFSGSGLRFSGLHQAGHVAAAIDVRLPAACHSDQSYGCPVDSVRLAGVCCGYDAVRPVLHIKDSNFTGMKLNLTMSEDGTTGAVIVALHANVTIEVSVMDGPCCRFICFVAHEPVVLPVSANVQSNTRVPTAGLVLYRQHCRRQKRRAAPAASHRHG